MSDTFLLQLSLEVEAEDHEKAALEGEATLTDPARLPFVWEVRRDDETDWREIEAEKWLTQWGLDGKLPPGVQGNSTECVLAHALGGEFPGDSWTLPEDRLAAKLGFPEVEIPDVVKDFIDRFDNGEYPDLIQQES
jgi:hypothetical protein